jgi:hypothetical protein
MLKHKQAAGPAADFGIVLRILPSGKEIAE